MQRIDNVNMDYFNNLTNLLKANNSSLVHPRTHETIIGTSGLDKKKLRFPKGKIHLRAKPFAKYCTRTNQKVQKGYRFIVTDKGIQAQKYYEDVEQWLNIPSNLVKYARSNQRKSVWFTKHQRRK